MVLRGDLMNQQKPIKLSFSAAFQVKYCLVVLATFACANVLLYLMMNKALGGSYLKSLQTLYLLAQNLPFYLSVIGFLQIVFILVLTLVITLLISHQIAGPIFRYEVVLGQIASGDFPAQIETRQTDQLKSTVDSLNELSTSLRGVYSSAQTLSEQLTSLDDVDKTLLQRQITRVRENMGQFNVEGEKR